MPMVLAKCKECNFRRHILIGGTNLRGKESEQITTHSYRKGHTIQIGKYEYKAPDEEHLKLMEDEKKEEMQ